MPVIIRIALVIDLVLVFAEAIVPPTALYLPVAGSHVSQLGVALLVGTITLCFQEIVAEVLKMKASRRVPSKRPQAQTHNPQRESAKADDNGS